MPFLFKSELLTEVEESQIPRYVASRSHGFQEKFNGDRRTIVRDGNSLIDLNREGAPGKGLSPKVKAALLSHPLQKFIVDIELMKPNAEVNSEHIKLLDVLILGNELLAQETYEYREQRAHQTFDNLSPLVHVVYTAKSADDKAKLVWKLKQDNAEGIVVRRMDAPYKQGRAKQHMKIKFWKDMDVVVLGPGHDGHESIRVGVFDKAGKVYDVCGVSLIGKGYEFTLNGRVKRGLRPLVVGTVIKIFYLYATKENHVVQSEFIETRDDKQPRDCWLSQLKLNKNWIK